MIRFLLFFIVFLVVVTGYSPGYLQFYKNIVYSLRENEPVLMPLVYLGAFSLLFCLGFAARSVFVRCFFYLITFVTCATELSYRLIGGTGFGFNEANVVTREAEMAGSAFATFTSEILISMGVASVSTLVLVIIAEKVLKKWNSIVGLPVFAIAGAYAVLSAGGHNIVYFPVTLKAPLSLYKAYSSPLYYGPRDAVTMTPIQAASFDHIVYLVDESVRGDVFSLNGYDRPSTPYLVSIKDKMFNYGVASSAANCSAPSNILLQTGVRPDQLPDTEHLTFKNPNIFQYAKASGYKTIYLDGQTPRDDLINYMTKHDVDHIDQYHQTKKDKIGIKDQDLDRAVADYIVQWVNENERSFIYALKNGAHFHYEDGYPEDRQHFKPVLSKGSWNHDRERTVNSFLNVIRWSVDDFFAYLVDKLGDKSVLIIYTSDHGQGLYEDNNPSTHCMVGQPPAVQANVPLFILPTSSYLAAVRPMLTGAHDENYNRVSHFDIFPTVLQFMGYPQNEVTARYGKGLNEPQHEKRVFFSGDLWGRAHLDHNAFDE